MHKSILSSIKQYKYRESSKEVTKNVGKVNTNGDKMPAIQ